MRPLSLKERRNPRATVMSDDDDGGDNDGSESRDSRPSMATVLLLALALTTWRTPKLRQAQSEQKQKALVLFDCESPPRRFRLLSAFCPPFFSDIHPSTERVDSSRGLERRDSTDTRFPERAQSDGCMGSWGERKSLIFGGTTECRPSTGGRMDDGRMEGTNGFF
jgi:hypothetical protein